MRPSSLLFALPLMLALGAATAHAGGNAAGVVVTGEATMQAPLASELEGWLKAHGRDVVASPLEPDAINTLVDCFVIENESCAKGVFEKRAKADIVVFARIDVTAATDGTRDVTLTGYWFAKGHNAVTERRFCERCTEELLRATADGMMIALSGSGSAETGHLKCVSRPAAARVDIDGHSVGVTPLDFDLVAGDHQITITADEHQVEVRAVTVRRGQLLELDVPLLPGHGRHDATHPDDDNTAPRSHLVPEILFGVGGVAVVAGVVMITQTGKPSATGPQSPSYTSYRPPGIGVAIGGAAAIGVGLYMWMHHSESAPTVAVTQGGGLFGWTGSF